MEHSRQFDLTPSPRVLRMLGQVDFKPWQCLAELADNGGRRLSNWKGARRHRCHVSQVNIEVSSDAEIRAGAGIIRVADNAPGMDPSLLERAVRAGYSGNNSVDKLGLFGNGFQRGDRTAWEQEPRCGPQEQTTNTGGESALTSTTWNNPTLSMSRR